MPNLFRDVISDKEVWRDVTGFEGLYQVSNLGRVKSLNRTTSDGKHVKGKLIASLGSTYKTVNLWKEGKGYNKLVHRLVAEAFIPNPNSFPEVNHKDKNVANNVVENLEWCTSAENHRQGVATRPASYSYRRKVRCLETKEVFASISAAGRSVNADATQIIESIEAKRCCKGQTFVYEDNIPEDIDSYLEEAHSKYQDFHGRPNMKNARKVKCVETGQIFDSIATAAKFYNVDSATIKNRIKAAKPFNGTTLQFV